MLNQRRNEIGTVRSRIQAHELGRWCIGSATLALMISWLILHNWDSPTSMLGRTVVQFALLVVAGSTLAALVAGHHPFTWLGPSLFWLVFFGLGVADAVRLNSLTALVEPWEALVITLAIAASVDKGRSQRLYGTAVAAAAGMLLLFGAIHLLEAKAVSQLVPNWIPVRELVPYVTGSILVAGALALWSGRTRLMAARAIALMFLSWLPAVHVGRIMNYPEILGEWRFALTALALAGALLIMERRPAPGKIAD
jgi:uncharacterized membrane protein